MTAIIFTEERIVTDSIDLRVLGWSYVVPTSLASGLAGKLIKLLAQVPAETPLSAKVLGVKEPEADGPQSAAIRGVG